MRLKSLKIKLKMNKNKKECRITKVEKAIAIFLVSILIVFFATVAIDASADVSVGTIIKFNNDNILTTPHPAPVSGGWDFGDMRIIPLESGKTMFVERYIISPEYGVSIFKYSIDDAYWYVTDKGIIYGSNEVGIYPMASSGLQALSIYLTWD